VQKTEEKEEDVLASTTGGHIGDRGGDSAALLFQRKSRFAKKTPRGSDRQPHKS